MSCDADETSLDGSAQERTTSLLHHCRALHHRTALGQHEQRCQMTSAAARPEGSPVHSGPSANNALSSRGRHLRRPPKTARVLAARTVVRRRTRARLRQCVRWHIRAGTAGLCAVTPPLRSRETTSGRAESRHRQNTRPAPGQVTSSNASWQRCGTSWPSQRAGASRASYCVVDAHSLPVDGASAVVWVRRHVSDQSAAVHTSSAATLSRRDSKIRAFSSAGARLAE